MHELELEDVIEAIIRTSETHREAIETLHTQVQRLERVVTRLVGMKPELFCNIEDEIV